MVIAMPDSDDQLTDDLAGGLAGLIPVIGSLAAPFAARLSKKIRAEWVRNNSKALQAAERLSGLSREELADRISDEPRLIPLTIRVLYAAGMTGQDNILAALGVALGHAVQDPEKIDETELLLIGMAQLRKHHVVVLQIMVEKLPHSTKQDQVLYWGAASLADRSGYSRDIVTMSIAGLLMSGLIQNVEDAYGVCYEITDLGRTALGIFDELAEEQQDKAR
jgi:DNA-binding MarR family transcriptional regulator